VADKEPASSSEEPTSADDPVDRDADQADQSARTGSTAFDPAQMDRSVAGAEFDAEDPAEVDPAEPSGEDLLAESDTSGASGLEVDDREPVSVGAAPAGDSSETKPAPAARVRRADPERKATPTSRRDKREPAKRRTGPVTFVRESVGELRKVVYPTGPQLLKYFIVVLIFVLFVIAYVSLLDLGFGAAMFQIFA
jgi:preprotein translocase subunit SecE